MEGTKVTYGKGNRILYPEPLSGKSGVGSLGKAWEGNRVQHTSKEVGIAYGSFRSLGALHAVRRVFSGLALLLFLFLLVIKPM